MKDNYFYEPREERPFKPLLGPLTPTSHKSMVEVVKEVCRVNPSI